MNVIQGPASSCHDIYRVVKSENSEWWGILHRCAYTKVSLGREVFILLFRASAFQQGNELQSVW